MSDTIRILLLLGAVATFAYVYRNVHKSKMKAEDYFFWIGMAGVLVLFAFFPGILVGLSRLIGIDSPANLVFLLIIFLLLLKLFSMDRRLDTLQHQMVHLIQKMAIYQLEQEEKGKTNERDDLKKGRM